MTKRSIRLKEMTPGIDVWHTPRPEYRLLADGSLPEGPFRARTDANGFLRTGNDLSGDSAPLVFLGGSFVESMFVDEHLRFVAGVERCLFELGHNYHCLNGGYSGSTSLQLLSVVINKVFPIVGKGGRLVFFVPQSDIDSILLPSTYWNANQRSTPLLPGREPTAKVMPEGLEASDAVLRTVVDACRNLDMKLILAVSPFRLGDFQTDQVLRAKYRRDEVRYSRVLNVRLGLSEIARRVAGETLTPLVDISMSPTSFYDELHLNEEGQRAYSKLVSDRLNEIFTSE